MGESHVEVGNSRQETGAFRHERDTHMIISSQNHRQRKTWRDYAATKVSTEFDSEGGIFVNKISSSLLNGLAKFKTSFQRLPDGSLRYPLLGVVTKYLSVLYDLDERNALVTLNGNLGRHFHLKYLRDVKAEQADLKLRASAFNDLYKAELSFDLPPNGRMPRSSFTFPVGRVRIEEDIQEDEDTGEQFSVVNVNGLVGGTFLGGLSLAEYTQEGVNLKYTYKDEEMTVRPSLRLPQQAVSVVFKRQFTSANKASFKYNFQSTSWSGVYKHEPIENFKLKVGYDSDIRLCWGSAWVGKEDTGAKKAPRKIKLQIMVQVPQDDVQNSIVLFRIKKRWDL